MRWVPLVMSPALVVSPERVVVPELVMVSESQRTMGGVWLHPSEVVAPSPLKVRLHPL